MSTVYGTIATYSVLVGDKCTTSKVSAFVATIKVSAFVATSKVSAFVATSKVSAFVATSKLNVGSNFCRE